MDEKRKRPWDSWPLSQDIVADLRIAVEMQRRRQELGKLYEQMLNTLAGRHD